MTEKPATVREFRLPDLGEGLTEGEWVSWAISVGDRIEINEVIGEVETAKATVELPSPYAGTVVELLAEPGRTIPVGAPLLRVAVGDEDGAGHGEPSEQTRPSVLVGYGPGDAPVSKRARRTNRPVEVPANERRRPDAKPGARKLAALLGVDLASIAGTGPGGVITRADVREAAAADEMGTRVNGSAEAGHAEPVLAAPPTESRERVTRVPIRGVRRRTADAVTRSAFTAPHATVFLTCDATASVDLIETLRRSPGFENSRPTVLSVVSRALLAAVRAEPSLNSSWDDRTGEIVVHHDVHLGIATATRDGLKVPVVRDAHRLSFPDLVRAIAAAAEGARSGDASPADLTGSTVSVTNVGVFGVDGGTPILNPGESAILAVGAVDDRPWVVDGALAVRKVVTLSLTFDHRLVDGAEAGRALASIGAALGDPVPALLAGP